MKNLLGLLVIGCVVSSFALLGCPGDDEQVGSGKVFQCNGDTSTAPDTFCAEFDANVAETNARSYCESDMVDGEFSAGTCRTEARVGTCATTSMGVAQTISFYAPMTLAQATDACAAGGGSFTAQ